MLPTRSIATALGIIALLQAAVWVPACSVYHKARSALPAEPGARVTLRRGEVDRAENRLRLACARLDAALAEDSPALNGLADRAAVAAWDLERHALAVADIPSASTEDIEHAEGAIALAGRVRQALSVVRAEPRGVGRAALAHALGQ
jgi:hypothetical protein